MLQNNPSLLQLLLLYFHTTTAPTLQLHAPIPPPSSASPHLFALPSANPHTLLLEGGPCLRLVPRGYAVSAPEVCWPCTTSGESAAGTQGKRGNTQQALAGPADSSSAVAQVEQGGTTSQLIMESSGLGKRSEKAASALGAGASCRAHQFLLGCEETAVPVSARGLSGGGTLAQPSSTI